MHKVQTRVINVRSVHFIHSQWKSKRMLATYMRRMGNNNLRLGLQAPLVARNK